MLRCVCFPCVSAVGPGHRGCRCMDAPGQTPLCDPHDDWYLRGYNLPAARHRGSGASSGLHRLLWGLERKPLLPYVGQYDR